MAKLTGSMLVNTGKKENRRELDFYPTPPDVTHALMQFLHSECKNLFNNQLKIWEPACGKGDMSEVILEYGHSVTSTDLHQHGYGLAPFNFLNTSNIIMDWVDAIITNPPFNISEKFILTSLKKCDIVCMLLKSQYWHSKRRIKLFNDHRPAYILPLSWRPDFDGRGKPTMEVLWTVWIKGNELSTYQVLRRPIINNKSQKQLFV